MPRPTKKEDLISASNEQFTKLLHLIDEMTDEEKSADILPNECDKMYAMCWFTSMNGTVFYCIGYSLTRRANRQPFYLSLTTGKPIRK